ncbi:hypothetical protein BTN49_2421 [Candidatus Enterovibrio escicola]|uniref:Uncharacterized protein n=1 Tax=Candidatus Enterovibrio escicola TaxID=1927127 RepID=A0A2A5T1D0_9GAMM|nr:hypothetical protein BTN49_2421 [Candidatus Enterovibrio escacola]
MNRLASSKQGSIICLSNFQDLISLPLFLKKGHEQLDWKV